MSVSKHFPLPPDLDVSSAASIDAAIKALGLSDAHMHRVHTEVTGVLAQV